jgi:hypothetical protein
MVRLGEDMPLRQGVLLVRYYYPTAAIVITGFSVFVSLVPVFDSVDHLEVLVGLERTGLPREELLDLGCRIQRPASRPARLEETFLREPIDGDRSDTEELGGFGACVRQTLRDALALFESIFAHGGYSATSLLGCSPIGNALVLDF